MADDIILRQCRTCLILLPVSSFPAQASTLKDGSRRWLPRPDCKSCRNTKARATYPDRREAVIAWQKNWKINNPEAHRARKRASHLRHLEAHSRRCRKWALANPDKYKATKVASQIMRREYGWSRNSGTIKREIKAAFEAYRIGDQYWDVYDSCLIDKPTVDHIVPLSRGGTSTANNLVPTSLRNNSSKSTDNILIWMLKRAGGIQIPG